VLADGEKKELVLKLQHSGEVDVKAVDVPLFIHPGGFRNERKDAFGRAVPRAEPRGTTAQ
jgi:hypothetical protein